MRAAFPDAAWLTVELWCPRPLAEQRLLDRGAVDLTERLIAWDETARLTNADLNIDTASTTSTQAALAVDRAMTMRIPGN